LVLRRTHLGTDRASGGLYERPFLQLSVFGSDGLMERFEPFDVGDEDDALARFDELVLSPVERLAAKPRAVRRVPRRVRANPATPNAARTDAAIAARDVDALADGLGEDYRWLDHTMTGAEINRQGYLTTYRSLLRAQNQTHRHEPLATLGDALALCL